MGGLDKGLVTLNGRPLIEHAIERLRPQVGELIISANRNHEQYRQHGHRVVADESSDYPGPLAGVLSGLRGSTTEYVVITPCDAPFVTQQLVARLSAALLTGNTDVAASHDGERIQQAFLLVRTSVTADLMAFLQTGQRSIAHWLRRHQVALADFGDCGESFTNVNDVLERDKAETRLQQSEVLR